MFVRFSDKSPNGTGVGRSFRDLSRYLVSGSAGEENTGRVMWSESANIGASDPAQAWAEMAFIAENQEALKIDAKRRGLIAKQAQVGQKEETPVWHAVLSWHNGDKPDRARMMEAVRSFMAHHGLEHHQYVVFAHGDGTAPHLHIMANLVDPETGRSAKDRVLRMERGRYGVQVRSSDWANSWEMGHPDERPCPERKKNWEQRRANHEAWKAHQAEALKADFAGKPAPDAPKLRKVYHKGRGRHVWELMRSASQFVLRMLRGQAGAEAVAAKAAQKVEEFHREEWAANRTDLAKKAPAAVGIDREAIDAILTAATARQSTFTRADLGRLVRDRLGKDHTPERHKTIMAAVEASPALLRIQTETVERLTTREMVDTETRLVGGAVIMANTPSHAVPAALVEGVKNRNAWLTDEQRAALDHITAPAALTNVVGYAGTGKSTILRGAHAAWKEAGYEVRGTVYSGLTTKALEEGTGIKSQTNFGLIRDLKRGKVAFSAKTVLVIDEAGMVGSRSLCFLLDQVRAAGGKVVMVGDNEQLQAIDAGGAFRAIVNDPMVGAARLTTVQRQGSHLARNSAEWAAYEWQRQASKDFGDGKSSRALEAYAKRGHIHEHESRDDARAAVIEGWFKDSMRPNEAVVMIAAIRKEVQALNREARARLIAAGVIGGDRTITTTERVQGTNGQEDKEQPISLRVGIGERLMFTRNSDRLGVKNGTLGILERIDGGTLTIKTQEDTPRRIVVNLAEYDHLAYGYAHTAHKLQGITTHRAHVLATKSQNFDAHAAYVSMSRHRAEMTMHYGRDDFKNGGALARHLTRQNHKKTTLDFLAAPKLHAVHRLALAGDVRRLAIEGAALIGARARAAEGSNALMAGAKRQAGKSQKPDSGRTRDR